MTLRAVLCAALFAAAACGGAASALPPTAPPTADPTVGLAVPVGPVLFEPEQLIFPPEEFPLASAVARDAPVAAHGWERQFATGSSADFRWFTVRIFVLEPDVPSARFVRDNGCGSVSWPGERPSSDDLQAPRGSEDAVACRYSFADGQRILYYTTGYRNVGIVVAAQPKREQVTDAITVDWLAALARQQTAIIGRVLIQYPPPQ